MSPKKYPEVVSLLKKTLQNKIVSALSGPTSWLYLTTNTEQDLRLAHQFPFKQDLSHDVLLLIQRGGEKRGNF